MNLTIWSIMKDVNIKKLSTHHHTLCQCHHNLGKYSISKDVNNKKIQTYIYKRCETQDQTIVRLQFNDIHLRNDG